MTVPAGPSLLIRCWVDVGEPRLTSDDEVLFYRHGCRKRRDGIVRRAHQTTADARESAVCRPGRGPAQFVGGYRLDAVHREAARRGGMAGEFVPGHRSLV